MLLVQAVDKYNRPFLDAWVSLPMAINLRNEKMPWPREIFEDDFYTYLMGGEL